MNGTQIIRMSRLTNSAHGAMDFDPLYIIIPPYTEVKIEVFTDDTQDLDNFVTLTGRIYRWMYEDYNLEQMLMRFLLAAVMILEGIRQVG